MVFILAILLTAVWGCERMDATKYNGDGEISSIGKAGLTEGFIITFDKIDLRKEFAKQYKIIDCPIINKTYWLGIDIKTLDDELVKSLNGILSIKVIDSDNEEIVVSSAPLNKWRYSIEKPDQYYHLFVYYLEDSSESSFKMDDIDNKNLQLIVNYDPKFTEENVFGTIQLRVGGFK